ncbi:MAG: SH3 domain-containing protein [Oliverpabstia sp.]|nr:SH3 domain-containing protein [Oliverpabstia sp.]
MDDFREWLSDNLRYILLGLAIIAVLVVLFFGIRFLSSVFGEEEKDNQKVTEQQKDTGEEKDKKPEEETDKTPVEEDKEAPETTPEPALESEKENSLEKNAYPTVNTLMQKYYTALGKKDVEGLKELVDQLDPTEEKSILNSHYIEGYSNVEVYTKQGLTEGSYVVFACYGHKYTGYDTILPGLSCLYVETGEDGSLYIVAEPNEEQQNQMNEMTNQEDTQELIAAKQKEYDDALASDAALSTYLSELGVEGSAAMEAEIGDTVKAKSNCNVRAQASAESEKIGELVGGQEVKKTGEEGDWIQIEFNGQTGYVRGDLFQ